MIDLTYGNVVILMITFFGDPQAEPQRGVLHSIPSGVSVEVKFTCKYNHDIGLCPNPPNCVKDNSCKHLATLKLLSDNSAQPTKSEPPHPVEQTAEVEKLATELETCFNIGDYSDGEYDSEKFREVLTKFASIKSSQATERVRELEGKLEFEIGVANSQTIINNELSEELHEFKEAYQVRAKMLLEKDTRIKQLEEEIKEARREAIQECINVVVFCLGNKGEAGETVSELEKLKK